MEIIYSDENLIVVNKPPGISVHGGVNIREKTLTDFLLEKFPDIRGVGDEPEVRPGIVHRLDKDTSGVMVVARNQKSFEALKELFQKRLVEKTYVAIVCGRPKIKQGIISLPIGRLVKNPLRRGVEQRKSRIRGAREAVTEYKVLREGGKYSLVELKPKTGRMHQLRVHLKAIGHSVACDKVYGGKNVCCPKEANRQLLHAKSISFSFPAFVGRSRFGGRRPEGRRFHFEADVPQDFDIAQKQIV